MPAYSCPPVNNAGLPRAAAATLLLSGTRFRPQAALTASVCYGFGSCRNMNRRLRASYRLARCLLGQGISPFGKLQAGLIAFFGVHRASSDRAGEACSSFSLLDVLHATQSAPFRAGSMSVCLPAHLLACQKCAPDGMSAPAP